MEKSELKKSAKNLCKKIESNNSCLKNVVLEIALMHNLEEHIKEQLLELIDMYGEIESHVSMFYLNNIE